MRLFHTLWLSLALTCGLAAAQTGDFKRLQLTTGISLEVPSHWTILSHSTRNNLQAAGRALIENTGLDSPSGTKENLLAVNATPDPTGAMIRVSVTKPPEYSQADLIAATQGELQELAEDLLENFKSMEASGGPQIITVEPARVESWNEKLVLVIPYLRRSNAGPSLWQVVQYKIPLPDRLIEITLSYRESDSVVWRPILEKVKRSVTFHAN